MERCHMEARSQKRHIKAQQAMCSTHIPTNRILCQELLVRCNSSKKDTQDSVKYGLKYHLLQLTL